MAITVRFIGALRHASGADELTLDFEGALSVRDLMNKITKDTPALRRGLVDAQLDDPRPNTLILVNGREISVLDGLETNLRDGDGVVLVPVVHGG